MPDERNPTTAEAAAPCECGKTTWIECAERPRRECGLWDKKRHGANSQTTFPCTMCQYLDATHTATYIFSRYPNEREIEW